MEKAYGLSSKTLKIVLESQKSVSNFRLKQTLSMGNNTSSKWFKVFYFYIIWLKNCQKH